jgi:short-subunit dehydrogenase
VVIRVSFWLLVWLTHIQMSSAAGKVPAPGQAIYSASKHALNGYFASLRSEVPKIHILACTLFVNCISMLGYSLML